MPSRVSAVRQSPDGTTKGRPKISEIHLVDEARAGCEVAWHKLYLEYAPFVHAILLARIPRADTEDSLQEVFLMAFRKLPQLRKGEHLGAWLAAIARNLAYKMNAKQQVVATSLAVEPAAFASIHGVNQEADEIMQILRELPEAYCETLTLRLVQGFTGPEIADLTGRTHASVRVNLSRGMHMLRERLQKEGWS